MTHLSVEVLPQAFDERRELDRLISERRIVPVYQPIVELASGATVGYEALARGPEGSPLQMPGELFGAAIRGERLAELDWACRAAALEGALEGGLHSPTTLFVNIEPVAAMAQIPDQFRAVAQRSAEQLRVVFELTERALTDRPAEVLRAVHELRRIGAMIALDDVGVDPRSLALMPFLQPDVIKLDMSLVQGPPSLQMARTLHAVNAHAERTGAVVLAEGIETEEHAERALALGATHGQGWLYGRPAPPPTHRVVGAVLPERRIPVDEIALGGHGGETPFEFVRAARGPSRTASKRLLLALSNQLEAQASDLGPDAVVVANLQDEAHFTDATRRRYRKLAEDAAFVGIVGLGVGPTPADGIRGGTLGAGDPLKNEWHVCVVSPHFAAAMVARDCGDDGADMERRFEYYLTYERTLAVSAARLIMAKIEATTMTTEPQRF